MSHLDPVTKEFENHSVLLCDPVQIQGNAVGVDSFTMVSSCQSMSENVAYTATELLSNPLFRFHNLRLQWENDIQFLSSTNEICMHPAYQQMIGMGKEAIPLIIEELSIKPNHWFWALKAITGQDPVPISKRGRIKEMTKEWVTWWSKNKSLI